MSGARGPQKSRIRVIVAEDDPFARSLVADGLRALGYEVFATETAEAALVAVAERDPHVLVTDLNFGRVETGASLLAKVRASHPWVALVILTSHRSPSLAVDDADSIPEGTTYLVKSQLKSIVDLGSAVKRAIAGMPVAEPSNDSSAVVVSARQADVLRMLAAGASTRAIAERRGTTVRAAETMIARLYRALDLDSDTATSARVAAIHLWQQGSIRVKE